jgi:hypothetical protein
VHGSSCRKIGRSRAVDSKRLALAADPVSFGGVKTIATVFACVTLAGCSVNLDELTTVQRALEEELIVNTAIAENIEAYRSRVAAEEASLKAALAKVGDQPELRKALETIQTQPEVRAPRSVPTLPSVSPFEGERQALKRKQIAEQGGALAALDARMEEVFILKARLAAVRQKLKTIEARRQGQ